jgi:hypothetical protein
MDLKVSRFHEKILQDFGIQVDCTLAQKPTGSTWTLEYWTMSLLLEQSSHYSEKLQSRPRKASASS